MTMCFCSMLVWANQSMISKDRAVGFHLREAENGLAATEALAEETPDIILSDVMMPHLNGSADHTMR
ncbi:MAG: hypothetical protein WD490_01825 [Opitutales bacterium]